MSEGKTRVTIEISDDSHSKLRGGCVQPQRTVYEGCRGRCFQSWLRYICDRS